jgi:Zn-dependent M28 family amino/carboxypeptidase
VAPTAEPPWLAADLAGHVQGLAAAPRATVAQRDAARAYLKTQLGALGLEPAMQTYSTGENLLALLPATRTTPHWIGFGAHFDTVDDSPGANDNASGVAVVLAAARALAEQPCRNTGVVFMFFDQEEIGLVGSTVAANKFRNQTDMAVDAVYTIDQAGWDADDDLRFEIERPAAGMFAKFEEAADAVGAQVVETDVTSTDHEAFRAQGFPAAGVTEEYVSGDTTPHYHRPTDTAATVDAAYHRVAARMMIYLLSRELGAAPP